MAEADELCERVPCTPAEEVLHLGPDVFLTARRFAFGAGAAHFLSHVFMYCDGIIVGDDV